MAYVFIISVFKCNADAIFHAAIAFLPIYCTILHHFTIFIGKNKLEFTIARHEKHRAWGISGQAETTFHEREIECILLFSYFLFSFWLLNILHFPLSEGDLKDGAKSCYSLIEHFGTKIVRLMLWMGNSTRNLNSKWYVYHSKRFV